MDAYADCFATTRARYRRSISRPMVVPGLRVSPLLIRLIVDWLVPARPASSVWPIPDCNNAFVMSLSVAMPAENNANLHT